MQPSWPTRLKLRQSQNLQLHSNGQKTISVFRFQIISKRMGMATLILIAENDLKHVDQIGLGFHQGRQ